MSVPRIRVDYDEMAEVARRFGQQAEMVNEMSQRVRQCMSQLEDGGWIGYAADAFYAEMYDVVFPALDRLANALEVAQQATYQLTDQYRQAEEAAAALFHGGLTEVSGNVPNNQDDTLHPPAGDEISGGSNDLPGILGKLKDITEILAQMRRVSFEQFQLWANSLGIVDEFTQTILYYQDDALEILLVNEEWTRTLVQLPVQVTSGWGAFFDQLTTVSKLDKAFLGLDLGLTTWKYWDKGLFSNPEYYSALTTDLLFFGMSQIGLAAIAGLSLVGTPAVIVSGVVLGGVTVVNWIWGDDITQAMTPAFEWVGARLGSAKDWAGQQLQAGAEWGQQTWQELDRQVDEAAQWVRDKASELAQSFNQFVQDFAPQPVF